MEKELQRKIEWLEKRLEEQTTLVKKLESDRQLDRSSELQSKLKEAKKEKLKLKDHIRMFNELQVIQKKQ